MPECTCRILLGVEQGVQLGVAVGVVGKAEAAIFIITTDAFFMNDEYVGESNDPS